MSGGSSASAMPYIGSKISLITNSELRYEGTLVNINTSNSTVTLRNVRMSGTEGRNAPHFVMASNEIFDYIVFNGKDIKDLTVSEPGFSVKEDPAVVAVNIPPPRSTRPPPNVMMGWNNPRYNNNNNNHHRQQQQLMSQQQHYNQNPNKQSNANKQVVVGELSAQPNSSLKSQVSDNFNFEEANSKFVKGAGLENNKGPPLPTAPVYDKNTSFFDNISCESLNRQHGRDSKIDRERQRELDTETFGSAAAVSRGPKYYRRGYRRGGMRGRGGMYGGGMMMRNQPGAMPAYMGGGAGFHANRYGGNMYQGRA